MAPKFASIPIPQTSTYLSQQRTNHIELPIITTTLDRTESAGPGPHITSNFISEETTQLVEAPFQITFDVPFTMAKEPVPTAKTHTSSTSESLVSARNKVTIYGDSPMNPSSFTPSRYLGFRISRGESTRIPPASALGRRSDTRESEDHSCDRLGKHTIQVELQCLPMRRLLETIPWKRTSRGTLSCGAS